jgi:hypothetical protein
MGLLNGIKKLLFGQKTTTDVPHAQISERKADSSDHLLDVNEDFLKNKSSMPERGILDEVKDSQIYKQTSEVVDKVSDAILDTGEKFMEKSKEFIDGPGKEAIDKFGDLSEKIGEKVTEGGKALYDKASDIVKKLGEKLDETIQKTEEYSKSENREESEFADTEFKVKDTELPEDFFNKADRFTSGDYSDFPKTAITKPEKPESASKKDISGFEDKDNDGDSLIDDAIIIDEK